MKKLKLSIVGMGYMGKVHLRNCTRLKSAELVSVSDVSRRALNYARQMGCRKTYVDYHEMLKDNSVDAVIIALPNFLHETCVRAVAEAGKDILLEKPLARNEEEGKEILAVVRDNGVKLAINYPLRFNSCFADLKEKIDDGLLGDVQNAHAVLIGSGPFFHRTENSKPKPVPEWWFSKELTGGGALIDLGCHLLNLLRWYFGDITSIKSYLGYRHNLDTEDYALCIAKFRYGTLSYINVGWFSQKEMLKVEMYGTIGHECASRKVPSKVIAAIQQLLSTSSLWAPYVKELEHFIECITKDETPSPSGEDGLKDLEAICQAYKNRMNLD